jgi:hypothetical protein
MADENGVSPDAQQIPVTEIFFAGGLQVRARGQVAAKVWQAAKQDNRAHLEDLNGNATQVKSSDVLATVEAVLIPKIVGQPAGTPGGQPFKPVVMGKD